MRLSRHEPVAVDFGLSSPAALLKHLVELAEVIFILYNPLLLQHYLLWSHYEVILSFNLSVAQSSGPHVFSIGDVGHQPALMWSSEAPHLRSILIFKYSPDVLIHS